MKNIYRSLLLVIAGATQKELARQLKYLKGCHWALQNPPLVGASNAAGV